MLMDRNRLTTVSSKPSLPPYSEVTEKILGMCQTSCPKLLQWNDNFERLPSTPLHTPPFWWNVSPMSNAPWQCWSLEDFNYKNCKWEGCYKPCICQQKEDKATIEKCRFPNYCGYHTKLQKSKSDISDYGRMPDPRCSGQYHQSLLENTISQGTILATRKTKRNANVEKDCLVRGYIPGDVQGWRGWSGKIGADPMHGEFNNSIFPIEDSPCYSKLIQVAEAWDGKSRDKDEINRQPPYKCYFHDPRLKYGIGPEKLNNDPNNQASKVL